MKLTKTLGAFALTAALAMGAIPAFAAGIDVSTVEDQFVQQAGDADNTASASTTIKGTAINSMLNAVIPIELTVVTPSTGGALVCPDATAYRITNKGTYSIDVIQAKATGSSFQMVDDYTNITSGSANRMSMNVTSGGKTINLNKGMNSDGSEAFSIAGNASAGLALDGGTYVNPSKPLAAGALADTLCVVKYTIAPTN